MDLVREILRKLPKKLRSGTYVGSVEEVERLLMEVGRRLLDNICKTECFREEFGVDTVPNTTKELRKVIRECLMWLGVETAKRIVDNPQLLESVYKEGKGYNKQKLIRLGVQLWKTDNELNLREWIEREKCINKLFRLWLGVIPNSHPYYNKIIEEVNQLLNQYNDRKIDCFNFNRKLRDKVINAVVDVITEKVFHYVLAVVNDPQPKGKKLKDLPIWCWALKPPYLKTIIRSNVENYIYNEIVRKFDGWGYHPQPTIDVVNNLKQLLNQINNPQQLSKLTKNLLSVKQLLYCPVCGQPIQFSSDYLYKVFGNSWAYWFACLITHYRHEHISYYDKAWSIPNYREKVKEYKSYEQFKQLVNNRAKRQIIRKILKDNNLTTSGKINLIKSCLQLQFNDDKTIQLIYHSISKLLSS